MNAAMMQSEMKSMGRGSAAAVPFLLCDQMGKVDEVSLKNQWTSGPIQCLDRAVDERPGIIVVRFGEPPFMHWAEPLELCRALKRNSHTRDCLLLALLPLRHRLLLEKLTEAHVDFVKYIDDIQLDFLWLDRVLPNLSPDDRPDVQLTTVCPFLRYSPVNDRQEMTVCGAYLNRLVLGGSRLTGICETRDHQTCEYYLNPRLSS